MICYPAGASGRFLATVVFKLANILDEHVVITTENSGHAEHENKIIPTFNYVKNNNHPFVFRELIRDSNVRVTPVFSTHAYPKYNIITANHELDETKFITILVDKDDFPEIVANVLIKAEITQIKTILNSGKDLSEFKHRTYYFGASYILAEFKNRYGYEITLDNIKDRTVIKHMYDIELPKREKYNEETLKFMSPDLLPVGLDNRMLKIRYKDIFKKTENSYVALEQISDFLELPVPLKIFESYEKYVTDQTTMMTTYFPWLDVPRLQQNT